MVYVVVYNKMSDKDKTDEFQLEVKKSPISSRKAKKLTKLKEYLSKQEKKNNALKVSGILKKKEEDRTDEEKKVLADNGDIVQRIHKNKERRLLSEQRVLETEDSEQVLQQKCQLLAKEILQSKQTVIYTGAGISTAASIPDYRGPQGVWTLLQKGEQLIAQDLSDAEPTLTHMCITALHQKGHVSHVVSQNCDGLHLRSGLPRKILSEVHGNMFIEICYTCKPHREYIRLFDVTEKTGVRRHFTGRECKKCGGKLQDTIVHFGEKGRIKSPYRWKEAVRAAKKCDLILCLGSSLKILKKYSCLWCMDRARHKRPKLAIVNLQWTPKDSNSFLKVNGKCDDVLERVMRLLQYNIPKYSREKDPIFLEAIALEKKEQDSTSKKVLERPSSLTTTPLRQIPRSPSPSISSDSSDSESSEMSESSGDNTDLSDSESEDVVVISDSDGSDKQVTKQEQLIAYSNGRKAYSGDSVKHELNISSIISKVKDRVQPNQESERQFTKEEIFMLKSEKICNEAKMAMGPNQVNTRLITKEESSMLKSKQICIEAKMAMQLNQMKSNTVEIDNKVKTQLDSNSRGESSHILFQPWDVNKNGFHKGENQLPGKLQHSIQKEKIKPANDEVELSYEDKLKYLQTLQSQLQALKQTQQMLKQRESTNQGHNTPQNNACQNHDSINSKWCTTPTEGQRLVHNTQSRKSRSKTANAGCQQGNVNSKQTTEQAQLGAGIYTQNQLEEYIAHEQKVNKDLIEAQTKQFEKEKNDMKRRQENDHRRIYQQFVIQVQVAEQVKLGDQRKTNMLQVFQTQQKQMVEKQTVELQELFKKHQQEQQALTEKIVKKQRENGAFLESLKIISPSKDQREPLYTSNGQAPFIIGGSNSYLHQASHLALSPGSRSSMLTSPELVSPQCVMAQSWNDPKGRKLQEQPFVQQVERQEKCDEKEFTHVKQGKYNKSTKQLSAESQEVGQVIGVNTQTETKIPGFNELVEGIISCESCNFLKMYGMNKRTCSQCDGLKKKYGMVNGPVEDHFKPALHMLGQDALAKSQLSQYIKGELKLEQDSNLINQYLQVGIGVDPPVGIGVDPPAGIGIDPPVPVGPAYVNIAQSSIVGQGRVETVGRTDSHNFQINLSQIQTLPTSSMELLACPENSDLELSPVIPYASSNIDDLPTSSNTDIPLDGNIVCIMEDSKRGSTSDVVKQDNLESGNQSENVVFVLSNAGETQADLQSYNIRDTADTTSFTNVQTPKQTVDVTPFRQRSQSVLIKHDIESDKGVVRSHSLSDVLVSEGQKDEIVTDSETTPAKLGKKRKSATNVSIPGWFGKGLNLKKRRK